MQKIKWMLILTLLSIQMFMPLVQGNDVPPIDEETVATCDDAKNRAYQFALELIALGASQVIYYSRGSGFWIVVAVGSGLASAVSKRINYNECNDGDDGNEQAAYYHDSTMAPNTFERHSFAIVVSGVLATVLVYIGANIIRNVLVLFRSSGAGSDPICISQKITTGVGNLAFCNQ